MTARCPLCGAQHSPQEEVKTCRPIHPCAFCLKTCCTKCYTKHMADKHPEYGKPKLPKPQCKHGWPKKTCPICLNRVEMG